MGKTKEKFEQIRLEEAQQQMTTGAYREYLKHSQAFNEGLAERIKQQQIVINQTAEIITLQTEMLQLFAEAHQMIKACLKGDQVIGKGPLSDEEADILNNPNQ